MGSACKSKPKQKFDTLNKIVSQRNVYIFQHSPYAENPWTSIVMLTECETIDKKNNVFVYKFLCQHFNQFARLWRWNEPLIGLTIL